jgi:hypothetical protein
VHHDQCCCRGVKSTLLCQSFSLLGGAGHWLRMTSRCCYWYPRNYYNLRIRLSQRSPLLVSVYTDLLPWDPNESKTQLQHKWILEPGMTYGPDFDEFCLSLDPGLPLQRDLVVALGDWNKKKDAQTSQLDKVCDPNWTSFVTPCFNPWLPF